MVIIPISFCKKLSNYDFSSNYIFIRPDEAIKSETSCQFCSIL